MAHVAKHTKAAAGHLCAHYDRSAEHISNDKIDSARTNENYNLAPRRDVGQVGFINQRCGEVRCHNRKDVNVMCSWVVTAPKDLPEQDNRRFFEETYKFLAARYGGEQNVISSYVHMDEVTPHMHFAFVPVVADRRRDGYKVSAKEVVDRTDLRTFHEDLEQRLAGVFGREVGILNDATREGNKSIAELKREQASADLENAHKELAEVRGNIKHLQAAESSLQAKIEGMEGQVITRKELESIQPQKTVTGALKGVTAKQVQDLKKTAVKYHEMAGQNKQLQQDYKELKKEYARVKKKVPTIEEQLAQGRSVQEVKELRRQLRKADKFISRIPEDVRQQIEQELKQEKRQGRNYEMER